VAWTDLLPRGSTSLEVSECLRQFQWLYDNPLLLLVISDLGVAGEREVLSQWVTVESIIGHDSSQIRVIHKEYSEKIIDLTLVPVGTVIQAANGRDWGRLVGICLHPDAGVVAYG
jgi:hypothetical protein